MKEALSDLLTFRLLEIILSEPKTEPQSFLKEALSISTVFAILRFRGVWLL